MPQTVVIPFGARAERGPYTVTIDVASFAYDRHRQVNMLADGGLWCRSGIPGSCTSTNADSKNDDTADPYRTA